MPRVSGVSSSSTVWRILRSPIPWTVAACVRLNPIGLRTSVIFSFFFACSAMIVVLRPRASENLVLVLATQPRQERRILQLLQRREGRAHHVVRIGGAERLG